MNWALYHGEQITGVTVIHMTPRIDAGPCIAQAEARIGADETAEELEPRLAALVVLDPLGRIVQRLDPGRGITTVELPPAPGVYMLEARYATGAVVRMPVVRR